MDTNDYSFLTFLELSGNYPEIPAHLARIASVLQRTANGNQPRVILATPQNHGVTKLLYHFMAYLKEKHVMDAVDRWERGAVCARGGFGHKCVPVFTTKRPPIRFATHSQSTAEFLAGKAASLYPDGDQLIMATTVDSTCVGFGFDTAIVTKPYPGVDAAADPDRRAQINDWFTRSLMPRMVSPESPIIVNDCRWHKDDLIGHILENHADENWHVVYLPVVKLDETPEYLQGSCTIESDWRNVGDVLDPTRFQHRDLQTLCKRVKPDQWNARWMLNPTE